MPIPIEPEFKILIASVAPLFPAWNIMSAPVEPAALVERSESVEVVPVPPIISGAVALVVIVGVTIVGEVSTTNLLPVPVWEAIEVALPTEVIGPVRSALVVTVSATPAVATFKLATRVVEEMVKGAVPVARVEVITSLALMVPLTSRVFPGRVLPIPTLAAEVST